MWGFIRYMWDYICELVFGMILTTIYLLVGAGIIILLIISITGKL